MLLLTRRPSEIIVIELEEGKPPITITVAGVNGNQVRIGVDAPREVGVHRLEVFERIQAERRATTK